MSNQPQEQVASSSSVHPMKSSIAAAGKHQQKTTTTKNIFATMLETFFQVPLVGPSSAISTTASLKGKIFSYPHVKENVLKAGASSSSVSGNSNISKSDVPTSSSSSSLDSNQQENLSSSSVDVLFVLVHPYSKLGGCAALLEPLAKEIVFRTYAKLMVEEEEETHRKRRQKPGGEIELNTNITGTSSSSWKQPCATSYDKTAPTPIRIAAAVYDQRGVGRSSGSSTWFAGDEVQDFLQVVDFLTKGSPKGGWMPSVRNVIIVGSSAGAAISGSALSALSRLIPNNHAGPTNCCHSTPSSSNLSGEKMQEVEGGSVSEKDPTTKEEKGIHNPAEGKLPSELPNSNVRVAMDNCCTTSAVNPNSAPSKGGSALKAYIALGYPFGWWSSWVFSDHYSKVLAETNTPKLFLLGTKDQFTSVSTLEKKVGEARKKQMNEARGSVIAPMETCILNDLQHFDMEVKATKTTADLVVSFILPYLDRQRTNYVDDDVQVAKNEEGGLNYMSLL